MKEKELLIAEINHRVKNNFSILISLMHLSKEQESSKEAKLLLEEYEHRIFSMMKIQDLLFETENHTEIKITSYLNELIKEFKKSQPELANNIVGSIEESNHTIHSKSALHIGLIITEIFLNAVKHTSKTLKNYSLSFTFSKIDSSTFVLQISDNGAGFNFDNELKKNTMGLTLIKELAKGLNFTSQFPSIGSSVYTFKIPA